MAIDASNNEDGHWDLDVTAKTRLFDFRLRELVRYRFLILLFVKRDFAALYKQTILGPIWFLLQPVLTSSIFTILFSVVAKIPTDGIPPFLFNLSGVTLWAFFTSCLTATSTVLISNSGLFGKVYFPRLSVPISILVTRFYSFLIQLGFFLAVYFVLLLNGAHFAPNLAVLTAPVIFLQVGLLGTALGLFTAAMTVKYRDLIQLISFGATLLMYSTPVLYPRTALPAHFRDWVSWNPMTAPVEMFRFSMTGVGHYSYLELSMSFAFTLTILLVAMVLYQRAARNYIDLA